MEFYQPFTGNEICYKVEHFKFWVKGQGHGGVKYVVRGIIVDGDSVASASGLLGFFTNHVLNLCMTLNCSGFESTG